MESTVYSRIIPFGSTNNADLNKLIEIAVQNRNLINESDPTALGYYNWLLYCHENNINDEQRKNVENSHARRLSAVPTGFLDLSAEDAHDLHRKLEENTGSRDGVKNVRKWVLERSHSIVAIGREIKNFVKSAAFSNREDTILHTLYAINDVFYNMKEATTLGPYTTLLNDIQPVNVVALWMPYLAFILRLSFDVSVSNVSQQYKIRRLLNLWESKGFLGDQNFQIINSLIDSVFPPQEPLDHVLANPYLEGNEVLLHHQIYNSDIISDEICNSIHHLPRTDTNEHHSNSKFGMISAGFMVDIIKFHSKSANVKYSPVETQYLQCIGEEVESGRIEARVNEFYRKVGTQGNNRKRHREG